MSENKLNGEEKVEKNAEDKVGEAPMRQIIIETNGNDINIVKADVAGNLELTAILNALLGHLNKR